MMHTDGERQGQYGGKIECRSGSVGVWPGEKKKINTRNFYTGVFRGFWSIALTLHGSKISVQ